MNQPEVYDSQVALVVKNPPARQKMQVGPLGWEDFPEGGCDSPLRYSCLESPMGRGAWQTAVHRVAKTQTYLCPLRLEAPSHLPPLPITLGCYRAVV